MRLRGLRDHGVSADERGPELVPEQRRGEVPRDDGDDDTERPLDDEPVGVDVEVRHVGTAETLREARVVLQCVDEPGDLDPRLAKWLALFERELQGQVVALGEHRLGSRTDDRAASRGRGVPPGRESVGRAADRLGSLGRPAARDTRDLVPGRRVADHRRRCLGGRRHHAPLKTG